MHGNCLKSEAEYFYKIVQKTEEKLKLQDYKLLKITVKW